MAADVVVLDLERRRDTATFFAPQQSPGRIERVLVNGTPVVESGTRTAMLAGKVITVAETTMNPWKTGMTAPVTESVMTRAL